MSSHGLDLQAPPGWRAATAVRVFALATALGEMLRAGTLDRNGIAFLSLALLAVLVSAVDLKAPVLVSRVLPVAEGVLATSLLLTVVVPGSGMTGYLAIPPLVAGLRAGAVTTVSTSLATALAAALSVVAAQALDATAVQGPGVVIWLALGTVMGLLSSWWFRDDRRLEERQAPYVEARRLLTELRSVSRRLPGGLDQGSRTLQLLTRVLETSEAERVAWYDARGEHAVLRMEVGERPHPGEPGLAQAADPDAPVHGACLVLPVTSGGDGSRLVVTRSSGWDRDDASEVAGLVARHGIELETATLFEEVRRLATTEERNRLARDIHDGIAQEVASLGYLADELAATTTDPSARNAAEDLRHEITRVVSELRLSIFDLRHDLDGGGLSGALAEYVREVGARTGLRLHLSFDETPDPVPVLVEAEVLRIAQEALTNVRHHAGATNVWITLESDRQRLRLRVEDDGVGGAAPREGHYGLTTMRERADRIGAHLDLSSRPSGGTTVTLEVPLAPSSPSEPTDPSGPSGPAAPSSPPAPSSPSTQSSPTPTEGAHP